MRAIVLASVGCALACAAGAQSQAPGPEETKGGARLAGQVLAEDTGQPLRRARVILQSLREDRPALGTETTDSGEFLLRDIPSGAYSLTAVRDGYLSTSIFRRGALRMPQQFSLRGDEDVGNLAFELRPWGVIAGRVRYEDGDPAVGVSVTVYREYRARGRRGFRVVSGGVTNDRGEYRIHGLNPGSYYAAASFEGDRTGPGVEDQPRLDNAGREIPVPSYTTTFYPGVIQLRDALPVAVSAGEEVGGIDLYFRPIERRRLRGRITSGLSGEVTREVALTLLRLDSTNTASIQVPAELSFDNTEYFTIEDVAPGSYELWVTASEDNVPLTGRKDVLVTNADIEDMEILLEPGRAWFAEAAVESSLGVPGGVGAMSLRLEPRSERGSIVMGKRETGGWSVSLAAQETYDVFVENLPSNLYFSQLLVGGADVRASGLTAGMAGPLPFRIVLREDGGRVEGRVFGPDSEVWSGAQVTLIPERSIERLQDYREAYADEFGVFRIGGVAPGRYTLVAWLDEAPCDIWDELSVTACRNAGMSIDVAPGELESVALNMKAAR